MDFDIGDKVKIEYEGKIIHVGGQDNEPHYLIKCHGKKDMCGGEDWQPSNHVKKIKG